MDRMKIIADCGIVPVVVLEDADQALPVARALRAGGINVMEITFRTAAAKESIRRVHEAMPEMIVGAGTVINVAQLEDTVEAGAQFIVSPGSMKSVIARAQQHGVSVLPGVATPSEIMIGLEMGIETFKFFPAEACGGLRTLKALTGPFPGIRFIPTGGINQGNAASYFENSKVLAVGGSWMVTGDMIRAGRFDEITEKSRGAVELFHAIRG